MDGTPIKARQPIAPEISRLVAEHRPGGPLERDFYVAPEVFAADLARIFHRHWIFVGYAFQVPRPGDFFTYKVGSESIIVLRDRAGAIRAFHNVCRHRGSRICKTEQGHAHRLVCPYHRWTYELDGSLVLDTSREFGVDKAELSLRPVAVEDAAGLLFVSMQRIAARLLRGAQHHPAQDEAARPGARQDRPPDRLCGEGQLEARVREQPRVLPLPLQPQGIQHRGLRRAARHGDARPQPAAGHGRHRGARQQPLPVAGARRGRCHVDHDRRVVALPSHAGDGRLRHPEPGRQAALRPPDGRHHGNGIPAPCAPPCFPISGSTPIATMPPPRG